MPKTSTKALFCSALLIISCTNSFAADVFFDHTAGVEPNSCGEVSNEIPAVTVSSGGVDGKDARSLRCVTDIDALSLELHKAGICNAAPDATDPSLDWSSKCVFIINSENGIPFTVSEGSLSSLPSDEIDMSGLSEGTYTHAILMVGNSVKTKMNAKFSQNFMGANGEGSFCYSTNKEIPAANSSIISDLSVKCVADEAAMEAAGDFDFSTKAMETFPQGGGVHAVTKTAVNGDRVHLFADLDTIAEVSGSSSSATKVVGVMEMSSPAVISASSNNFNAGFQLSGQGQIRFSGDGNCSSITGSVNGFSCIHSMSNYGVGFQVTID